MMARLKPRGSFHDGFPVISVVAGQVPGPKYLLEVGRKVEQRHYENPVAGPTVRASA